MSSSSDISPPPIASPFATGSPYSFQSPYLNLDPKALNAYSSSDYIYPDGRKRASRGRFECAFSQIGGSVMAGAAIGGIYGGYNGLKLTSTLNLGLVNKAIDSTASASTTTQTLSWAVRRSQILNYILKTGALTANTFGLVALVYSAADVGISYYLENDDVNSIAAGTVAGIVYRGLSTPEVKADGQNSKLLKVPRWQIRLRRGAIGGLIGLSLSSAFVLVSHRDKIFKK